MEATETVHADPVTQLLAAARRWPLLTAVEERRLAQRVERGDLEAKERLVNANLRLVVSIARTYQGHGLALADLVQEGTLGLIRAAERYDWRKGFRFSTYASIWIRQSIQRGLGNHARTIRIPVHVADRVRRLGRLQRKLTLELGREPVAAELAEATGWEVEEVEMLRDIDRTPTSLDLPIDDAPDGATMGELIPSDAMRPDEVLAARWRAQELSATLSTLPERERRIIQLRFGEDASRVETGRKVGLSPERVRGLEERALRRLSEVREIRDLRVAA